MLFVDGTNPVITLIGLDSVTTEQGQIYTDEGAEATDAVDDNDTLTSQLGVVSTVDISAVGFYTVTYTVSDSTGNPADPVVRTVEVTAGKYKYLRMRLVNYFLVLKF